MTGMSTVCIQVGLCSSPPLRFWKSDMKTKENAKLPRAGRSYDNGGEHRRLFRWKNTASSSIYPRKGNTKILCKRFCKEGKATSEQVGRYTHATGYRSSGRSNVYLRNICCSFALSTVANVKHTWQRVGALGLHDRRRSSPPCGLGLSYAG